MTTKTLDKERAITRYGELSHIIHVGAYSEIPPDDYEGGDDGSYWHNDLNITAALSSLEDRAAHDGLKFIGKQIDGSWFYTLETMSEEEQAVFQVTEYVYKRHGDLTKFSIQGFDDEDIDRMSTDKNGYLDFFVKDVEIEESEQDEDITTWYIHATIVFLTDQGGPIEGSTDIYQAYKGSDGQWIVEWHASKKEAKTV